MSIPWIPLDQVYWRPGWEKCTNDDFKARIRAAMHTDECKRGWIIDGNYNSHGSVVADEEATDIICLSPGSYSLVAGCLTGVPGLDPPFLSYFPGLVLRTFRRLLGIEPTCAVGCTESWRETFFSTKSIIWWCITTHKKMQVRAQKWMETMALEKGGNMRRIGSREELERWVSDVERLVGGEGTVTGR